jgi:Ca2+-binding RTX toxin-like protein
MRRAGHHRLLGLAAALMLIVGALAAVLALAEGRRGSSNPRLESSASGALSVSNSRDGGAIFAAPNAAPGDSATGTVTIENTGAAPGSLDLSVSHLEDVAGRRGGVLSGALDLTVTDVTSGSDARIYTGKLGAMQDEALITLVPGDARTYRFVATVPDSGSPPSADAADNAFQAASTSVDYLWTLTGAAAKRCGTTLAGDRGANRLIGTAGGDSIDGWGGADLIKSLAGADCDRGGAGADRIYGGGGRDSLKGGAGADHMEGGPGRDLIVGGAGSDVIRALDGGRDRVNCGPGPHDLAFADHQDRVSGCEVVRGGRR